MHKQMNSYSAHRQDRPSTDSSETDSTRKVQQAADGYDQPLPMEPNKAYSGGTRLQNNWDNASTSSGDEHTDVGDRGDA